MVTFDSHEDCLSYLGKFQSLTTSSELYGFYTTVQPIEIDESEAGQPMFAPQELEPNTWQITQYSFLKNGQVTTRHVWITETHDEKLSIKAISQPLFFPNKVTKARRR